MMRDIPEYGDHFTIEEMRDLVESKACIDYDGSGNFATATHMSDESFVPSEFIKLLEEMNGKYTHVVWFNR